MTILKEKLLQAMALLMTAQVCLTAEVKQLRGVGVFESSSYSGLGVSYAGGAEIMIHGYGFDQTPSSNFIYFETDALSTSAVRLPGTPISENNEFQSAVAGGKLQYTTPSLFDLASGITQEQLRYYDLITTELQVDVADEETGEIKSYVCDNPDSDCHLRYRWSQTPILWFTSPAVLYNGLKSSIYINAKNAPGYKKDYQMAVDIRLDGTSLDFEYDLGIDDNIAENANTVVQGIVRNEHRNMDLDYTVRFRGAGFALPNDITSPNCKYDGTDCYLTRMYPSITSISASSGYTSGGQELTIDGYSLDDENVEVLVDGVECVPKSISATQIVCITGPQTVATPAQTLYVGEHGVERILVNYTEGVNYNNYQNYEQQKMLYTSLELASNTDQTYSFDLFKGFFKAPTSGNYRFHLACDDSCNFLMSVNDPQNPNALQSLINRGSHTGFRDWDFKGLGNTETYSSWTHLDEGEYYYYEARLNQNEGDVHLSVGAEIDADSGINPWPRKNKQVMSMGVEQDLIRDTLEVNITGNDSMYYVLMYMDKSSSEFEPSGEIRVGCSADEFKEQIKTYYKDRFGTDPTVSRACVDVNTTDIDCGSADVYSWIYTVKVPKSIWGTSVDNIMGVNINTTALITFRFPEEVQVSNDPLYGQYQIECYNEAGQFALTGPLSYDAGADAIYGALIDVCPWLRDKIDIVDDDKIYWKVDGIDWQIWFNRMEVELPQFYIRNTTGDNPLIGNNGRFVEAEVRPYGPYSFIEVLPFEMLYTAETSPQVRVTVGDMPALCANIECDYDYETATALVTGMSVSGQTVVISGTDLPTADFTVVMSNMDCVVSSSSSTEITCSIGSSWSTGSWLPRIKTAMGEIPVDSLVTAHVVQPTITGITPSLLNPAGGDTVIITGTGFPSSTETEDDVVIYFSDGTGCTILAMTSTEIQCTSDPFDSARRMRFRNLAALDLILEINLESATETVNLEEGVPSVQSITPASASPIAFKSLVIQLDSSYPSDGMDTDTFSVKLIQRELGNINDLLVITDERPLRVVGVDSTAKTITVKYGGAYTGVYDLVVANSAGNIKCDIQFEVIFEINDYSPKQGSQLGGTLVTIQGRHFSDVATDNPVKIGYEYITGTDHYCYVVETSETEIKCRTAVDLGRTAGSTELIVFAATYEEATCNVPDYCPFEYLDISGLATLNGATVQWDAVNNKHQIVIAGEGITDTDPSQIQVIVGGIQQTTVSVSPTEIVADLDELKSGTVAEQLEVYLSVGAVNGFNGLLSGLTFEPKLMSISTNIGSQAGATIRASIVGAGVNDVLTLVKEGSTNSICETATMLEYGVLECVTTSGAISLTNLAVRDTANGNSYTCANADTTACEYQTYDEAAQPTISKYVKTSETQITADGVNLSLASHSSCELTFKTVTADTCTIVSSTQITADFNLGVPTAEAETLGSVTLLNDDGIMDNRVTNPIMGGVDVNELQIIVGIVNPLTITGSSEGLICSFNGGCTLEIQGQGLASRVKSEDMNIDVCGKRCTFREDLSDSSKAVCELPAIQTVASNLVFEITPSANIIGSTSSSPAFMADQVFDGVNMPGISGSGGSCWIRVDYTVGMVGALDELRFFMDYFPDTSTYDGALKFQGSNDGFAEDIVDIETVGIEIHEGWNYYDLTEIAPRYNAYRLYNAKSGGCNDIGQVMLYGQEVIDSEEPTHNCSVEVQEVQGELQILDQEVTYAIDSTPVLTKISPRYGSVEGNTLVTFNGNWVSSVVEDYTVYIDDLPCAVEAVSIDLGNVACRTAPRLGDYSNTSKLDIYIAGYGKVATQGRLFRYVSLWSQASTWGNIFAPTDGESVAVGEGLNLLVDIDVSPKLNAVIIDGGSLIFPSNDEDPNHQRTFDAHYIYVQHGFIEVGTEEDPYKSKLTITMHGKKYDPYIPIYGNKCIGVRFATIDIHGMPRDVTWTELDATVEPGSSQITLIESVDWQVGETIVVTSTNFNRFEAEKRVISGIDISSGKAVIDLDQPLQYKHYGDIDYYGESDFIEIRAEVGLLSRNVIYRGDPETSSANQYGAHIMVHSPGDETSVGRIEFAEFTDVGQAFQLGRYPIHFHMIGTVHKSYVRGNAVHQTYNRGTTIHGVHYLRVERNVYYNTMGHTIFIEDAAETKNYIAHNLVILTNASHSLLNTDSTPACFWITHPDNIFIGNHAAGSERYGFWFDLQDSAMGPSFDPNICPTRSKLGEFRDNVAHSVGRYGLRIFHGLDPHTRPCAGNSFDENAYINGEDPYTGNPPIQANFTNYLGYKNGRNGVIGEDLGAVVFKNIKAVDNKLAGLEINKVVSMRDNMAWMEDSVMVGRTVNNAEGLGSPHGVITPQTDGWAVKNTRFYNYDFNNAAALGSCSHCFKAPATDRDVRTVDFSELYFEEATVPRRIRYQFPFKGIYHDLDGTLTEMGPETWATSYFKHNEQPECSVDMDKYDGLLCDATVTVRAIIIQGANPGSMNGKDLYIMQFEDELIKEMDEATYNAYMADESNYSIVQWRDKKRPSNHWAVPFVTGKKYYLRWEYGLDFENIQIGRVNWLWNSEADGDLWFVMPHYDVREAIYVDDNRGNRYVNNTIGVENNVKYLEMGDNILYNQTEVRELNLIVNGRNYWTSSLFLTGVRCVSNCNPAIEDLPLELEERYWSNETHWGDIGRIPIEGDEVIIESGWNMVYDMEDSPKLNGVEVRGKLTFKNDGVDRRLNTYNLWVRSGELEIGTSTEPFTANANIHLLGDNTEEYFAFTNAIEAGNKNLVVTGTANLYGAPRDTRSRLMETIYVGDTESYVERDLDWMAGEKVYLAPTNMRTMDWDELTIKTYDPANGFITFEEEAQSYHFGAWDSTEPEYSVDMRGEVVMMNRTIRIDASQDDINNILKEPWGCRVLVSDFFEADLKYRKGSINMDYVQVHNCSQKYTWKAALKFENAVGASSRVSNSHFGQGYGLGIHIKNSQNIHIVGNSVTDFAENGIHAQNSKSITIDNNWVFRVLADPKKSPKFMDFIITTGDIGCITAYAGVSGAVVTNNRVAGCWHHGFKFIPAKCDEANPSYKFANNNVAHSISGYGMIAANVGNTCTEIKDMAAYKVTEAAMFLGGPSGTNRGKNLVSIDTRFGIGIHGSSGGTAELLDSISISEVFSNQDCPEGSPCDHCIDRRGMVLPLFGDHKDSKPKYKKFPLWSGTSAGTSNVRGHTFKFYNSTTTSCGSKQVAISPSLNPNFTPFSQIYSPIFIDQLEDAMTFTGDPKPGWANPEDCVDFTCTGPHQVVMRVENARFLNSRRLDSEGRMLSTLPQTYMMIADNKLSVSSEVIPSCERMPSWNGWMCTDERIGVLLFDSLDADRMDRSVQPVYVQNLENGFNNKLNSYMDTCWDGFYTCQKRETKFPSIVYLGWDEYNIEYTGTPPQKQDFRLYAKNGAPGMLVQIYYPNAGAYQLFDKNGETIWPTDWDHEAKTWAKPTGQYCGEFRYEGVINRLQFWIDNNCQLIIKPRDAIMLAIRMEFTMEEFFDKGGVTTFTDRMAAVLGIHKADLKVVQVYEGSTIVDFQVLSDPDADEDSDDFNDLDAIAEIFKTFVTEDNEFMDGVILGATTEGVSIFGAYFGGPGADETKYDDLIDKFKEELEKELDRQEQIEETKASRDSDEDDVDDDVIVKEVQIVTVVEKSGEVDTLKYVVVFFILVVVLAIAIVMLCFFRSCLKKQTRDEVDKIQAQIVKQTETSVNNSLQVPQGNNAPIDTQYSMKTKNQDDNLIGSLPSKKFGKTPASPRASSASGTPRGASLRKNKSKDKNLKLPPIEGKVKKDTPNLTASE